MDLFHILLVEDNDGDVLLTEVALENTGIPFRLSVLSDGKSAIDFLDKIEEIAAADKPDIILLDINLPKKNGHEVLKFIKGNDKLKQIPVIILSTSSSQSDIDMAYANYANCVITKPSEMDQFLNMVSAIVNIWSSISNLPSK
jgi:CheY-like chemotaxis protein